ncbi:MAG TPA: type I-U CRISPR-associated protein Csb2 [Methanothrix sp.]|nr:type I-U CRISPR-associated protein Csb2 [Methanothrix sp.]
MRLKPTVARYVVSAGRPVLLTDAIILADRVHETLVSLSDGASVFTGCDSHREPLQGNRHAYIFCESNNRSGEDDGGEITHIVVYASMGFGSSDLKALENLSEIWGENDLRVAVVLQGLGQLEDFSVNSAVNSVGMDADHPFCPLLSRSRIWVSRTPFIPTRHPKVTRAGALKLDGRGLQIGSPEHEVRRLLGLEGLSEIASVEPIAGTILGKRQIVWSSFRLSRDGGRGRRAGSRGYGFRIEFSEPVQGPLAVGYGAHFGMGLFVPEDDGQIREGW